MEDGGVSTGSAEVAQLDSKKERVSKAGAGDKKERTYRGRHKSFILHTNCFAEHFVFE